MQLIPTRAIGLLAGAALAGAVALPVAAADTAMVRVVHASPDAPNVDVWVDGSKVLTDVPFTAVSDYLDVPAGAHNVQVTPTGDTTAVIDADLTLEAGTAYTVAAHGMVADIAAAVFTDDRTSVAGKAKLRAIHLSPSAPASVDIAVAGGDVVVPGLAYPEASGYLQLDPGTYSLEIRAAGDTAAALTFDATLAGAQNVTAFAMDGGDAGVQVITALDAEGVAMPDSAMAPATSAPLTAIGLLALAMALVIGLRRLALARQR